MIEVLLIVIILFLISITILIILTRKSKTPDVLREEIIDVKKISNSNINEFQIKDFENEDIKISGYELNGNIKLEEFKSSDSKYSNELRTGLESIIHQSPNIANTIGNINYYKVVFKPEIMKGIESGLYNTMNNNYIIAIDPNDGNKIVGNAKILEKINPASVSLVGWQVLAIVTAQKFLSDINKNLDKIKKEVEEVKDLFENFHYFGKIKGDLKYLNEISNIILNNKLHPYDVISYNNQLENIDRDCLQLTESINLEKHINDLENLELEVKLMGGGSLDDKKNNLIEIIEDFEKDNRIFLMAKYLRLNTIQLKCALPINKSICDFRILEIEESLNVNEMLNEKFNNVFNKKIQSMVSFWRNKDSDFDAQLEVLTHRENFYNEIKDIRSEIKKINENISTNINDYKIEVGKEISLVVETDNDNNINSIKKLLE